MPKESEAIVNDTATIDQGTLSFSIESRILRELGERLVKQPEVAIVELVKNAYDADATSCAIRYVPGSSLTVSDDGSGMTLEQFTEGWMRVGTSSKELDFLTSKYLRVITGEKGIGRFAVRFLGRGLRLESVAQDKERGVKTRLIAEFDWPKFDKNEDLGKVQVPYRLNEVEDTVHTGTTLEITSLRPEVSVLDLQRVRTGSVGILTPLRSLFRSVTDGEDIDGQPNSTVDPGFVLDISQGSNDEPEDVASAILDSFVLRARITVTGDQLKIEVYRRGVGNPYFELSDTYPNQIGNLHADIRFFPRRKGTFTEMPVDGRLAQAFVTRNSGVAVFDRSFRVQPYGMASDDWLQLQADAARNRRSPRSAISQKHFPMSDEVRASTSENWMLRLPQSAQLIGLVQVEGRRHSEASESPEEEGLVASADREGFVENQSFFLLRDIVRGAVEAIAYVDRQIQQEEIEAEREALLASIKAETRSSITEVRENPNIANIDKKRIVAALAQTQQLAERQEESARQREQQLEIMSLLGVVAGYMTHEFGGALQELEEAQKEVAKLAEGNKQFRGPAESLEAHLKSLKEFVTYSSGYIQGARFTPEKAYPARPRLTQVKKYFGSYAEERGIDIEISAETSLSAPLVPASLYNGIALNLYTNALKAVTAKSGDEQRTITFRAWNEDRWHFLEVSDTGIGIPSALTDRVFDPLFTTTASKNDPLGSGMGLGLALVRRGVSAFGGRVELVPPPPGFSTCVRVRLPLQQE